MNTSVTKGSQIGIIGKTGTNLIHLHFEVRDGVQTSPLVIGSGDTRGHSLIQSSRFFKRIGLFPWYPNASMNSGFVPRSTSHPINKCVDNHSLTFKWPAPSEFDHHDGSGVDRFQGYDFELDHSNNTVPVGVLSGNSATSNMLIYPNLADGTWWFHARAYSTRYGWAPASSVAHLGPFIIGAGPGCISAPSEDDWLEDPEVPD